MTALLEMRDVHAAYGPVQVLRGLDLHVDEGEVVVLLGANGAGKTTTVRAICQMVGTKGDIQFDGTQLVGKRPEKMAALGIAHVPQGRGTFPELTVEENLEVGAYARKERSSIRADMDRWFQMFPRLAERRRQQAGSLSGGEQQMLAVARALMSRPRLLLLDEPSLGLAPIIIQDLFGSFDELNEQEGVTMFVVEQNAKPRPGHRRPRLRAGGRDHRRDRERGRAAGQRRSASRLLGVLGGPTMILAVPGIEDNFFTLTLFLQNLSNALANGAVYALMALTVVMIYKTTGHLNFAQGEMAMFTTFLVFVLADRARVPGLARHRHRRARGDVRRARRSSGCPDPAAGEPQRAGAGDPHPGAVVHPERGRGDDLGHAAPHADPGAVPRRPRRQDRHHHRSGAELLRHLQGARRVGDGGCCW